MSARFDARGRNIRGATASVNPMDERRRMTLLKYRQGQLTHLLDNAPKIGETGRMHME